MIDTARATVRLLMELFNSCQLLLYLIVQAPVLPVVSRSIIRKAKGMFKKYSATRNVVGGDLAIIGNSRETPISAWGRNPNPWRHDCHCHFRLTLSGSRGTPTESSFCL